MSHDPLCPVSPAALADLDDYCCANCNRDDIPPWERVCICDRLRACEQRVRQDEQQKIRSAHLTGIQVSEVNKAYVSGYKRALDAAREAVAALHIDYPSGVTAALAAIDALREAQK